MFSQPTLAQLLSKMYLQQMYNDYINVDFDILGELRAFLTVLSSNREPWILGSRLRA